MGLKYTVGEASAQEIYFHLKECNEDFVSSLNERVSLRRYSSEIHRNAVIFEAWKVDVLIGVVAAYFNDPDGELGYITNVSVVETHEGQGIASALIGLCIGHAVQHRFRAVGLEVKRLNDRAVCLYERFGFREQESKSASTMQMEVWIRE